ncbi:MAG: hypothetical protein IKT31_05990 [Firmicutes bacterium]|nr:hypothetical protein [Bacillota bacterium]
MKGQFNAIGKIILAVLLVCLLAVGFLFVNNDIGQTADSLESDIRSSQKIQDDWTVTGSVSDTMAGFISYPQNMSDHTFSVYVNRPGVSFGYFFRGGGSLSSVERYIAEFTVEGYSERAFISMNAQKAARVEIDNGTDIEVIEIDSEKPFALVLPGNAGVITFYDVNGEIVEYGGQRL